jgi:low affinity Fe/Cu permease
VNRFFARFATRTSDVLGHAYVFIIALLLVLLWAFSGPFFGFSDTWQLIINTGTTITTGLMVFIIQNTQNRDARAIHIKLDELLRAMQGARTDLADAEDRSEEELKDLKEQMIEECEEGESAEEHAAHVRRSAGKRSSSDTHRTGPRPSRAAPLRPRS